LHKGFEEGNQGNKIKLIKLLKNWLHGNVIELGYYESINRELNLIQDLNILNRINERR
jgi:hypothetical protein